MNTQNPGEERSGGITVLHPSWLNYFWLFFWGALFLAIGLACSGSAGLCILFLLIAAIFFLTAVLQRIAHVYTLTPDAVKAKVGIIARHEREVKIADIREIGVRQGVLQRLFRIGSVYFASAATAGIEVVFAGIKDPPGLKKSVDTLRSSAAIAGKKRCPQCGEYVWEKAKVCPHCGYNFA